MSRLLSDVDTLNQLFSQGLTQLLGALFGLVGILVAMLAAQLAASRWSCFTIIPAMLLTTCVLRRPRARRPSARRAQTVGDVTADLQEEIVGVRQAQAFNRTERQHRALPRRATRANRDANVQRSASPRRSPRRSTCSSTLSTALVIGYGGWLVLRRSLDRRRCWRRS